MGPPDVRNPAVAGRVRSDLAGKPITCECSLSPAQRQHLAEQLVRCNRARLDLLIADDAGRCAGIEPLDDLPAILSARIRALRLIWAGSTSIADLPRAGLPDWAIEATVKWREERNRRGGRWA
jgi:hypothetical protein